MKTKREETDDIKVSSSGDCRGGGGKSTDLDTEHKKADGVEDWR